jgi:hypothetical protein
MGKFVDICRESENHLQKLAIAADLRSGDMFTDAYRTLLDMERQPDLDVKILYIEAEDEVIIKRYKETRRKHPLDERFGGLRTGAAAPGKGHCGLLCGDLLFQCISAERTDPGNFPGQFLRLHVH